MLEDYVVFAILIAKSLIDGIVLGGEILGFRTLPRVAPSTVQASHLVGIGACEEDLLALGERQDSVILKQHLRLLRRTESLIGKLGTTKFLVSFPSSVGFVKQA